MTTAEIVAELHRQSLERSAELEHGMVALAFAFLFFVGLALEAVPGMRRVGAMFLTISIWVLVQGNYLSYLYNLLFP